MTRQIVCLVLWVVATSVWVAWPAGASTELLAFSKGRRIELGRVKAGKSHVEFDVRNTADAVVTVSKVSGSCTCMELEFKGGHLMPGVTQTCGVTINIKPGASQTSAVVFDITEPKVAREVVLIAYQGVQEDGLAVRLGPIAAVMPPESEAVAELSADWSSSQVIRAEETIQLSTAASEGVTLIEQRELQRSSNHLSMLFRLKLDAAGRDVVSATVNMAAGAPRRAKLSRLLTVRVHPSLSVHPDHIMLDVTASAGSSGSPAAECRISLANGWRIADISTPTWLQAHHVDGRLKIWLLNAPPFKRGVAAIRLIASDETGLTVGREVTCVVDS